MSAIWLDQETGLIAVRFAYDAQLVEAIKRTIPRGSRSWNPQRRLWLIDPPYETAARKLLGLKPPPTVSHPGQIDFLDALNALFAQLPDHLHDPTFKALMRVWHPDVGGDTRCTQILNAWRQKRVS